MVCVNFSQLNCTSTLENDDRIVEYLDCILGWLCNQSINVVVLKQRSGIEESECSLGRSNLLVLTSIKRCVLFA